MFPVVTPGWPSILIGVVALCFAALLRKPYSNWYYNRLKRKLDVIEKDDISRIEREYSAKVSDIYSKHPVSSGSGIDSFLCNIDRERLLREAKYSKQDKLDELAWEYKDLRNDLHMELVCGRIFETKVERVLPLGRTATARVW